jgi:hypothetical protein
MAAAQAPAPAPAVADGQPSTYSLTPAGAAFTARPTSKRHAAWQLLLASAGQPGGLATMQAAVNTAKHGTITGRNLLGWARKAGLVVLGTPAA